MKKICAMLLAVIMTAAVMTSCGNSDSSSEKETSSAAASAAEAGSTAESTAEAESKAETESKAEEVSKAEEESKADAESTAEVSEADSEAEASQAEGSDPENEPELGEYAKAYTEKIKGRSFSMDMTINSMLGQEMPAVIMMNGNDGYFKTNAMGVEMEVYIIDGKTYNIMPNMNAYYLVEGSVDQQNISTYELPDNAVFDGTSEEDGMIVENYTIPLTSSGTTKDDSYANKIKYYFDTDGTPKKIIYINPIAGESSLTINSISYDNIKIELPDLSGMTEMKQGQAGDTISSVKMTLAVFGIKDEMVTAAGYTWEQLAEMAENDQDAFGKAVKDIAEKNNIDTSLLELGTKLAGN